MLSEAQRDVFRRMQRIRHVGVGANLRGSARSGAPRDEAIILHLTVAVRVHAVSLSKRDGLGAEAMDKALGKSGEGHAGVALVRGCVPSETGQTGEHERDLRQQAHVEFQTVPSIAATDGVFSYSLP